MSGPWLASTVWEVCHAISQLPLASLPPSSLPPPPAPYFVTVCQCSDTLVDCQPDTMSSFEEQGVRDWNYHQLLSGTNPKTINRKLGAIKGYHGHLIE